MAAKNEPEFQPNPEPMGKGWRILAIIIVAVIVVAIIVLAVGIITHPA